MVRARAGRTQPGLRPQHLAAVQACAERCDADTTGLAVQPASPALACRVTPPTPGALPLPQLSWPP